jgi:hypothetical protein
VRSRRLSVRTADEQCLAHWHDDTSPCPDHPALGQGQSRACAVVICRPFLSCGSETGWPD